MNYLEKIKSLSLENKKKDISISDMFKNLLHISKLINEFEYFVFFGTLLGLVRENNIIQGDDDIDFYVNIKDRDDLIKKLKLNSIIINENHPVNKTKYFLQAFRNDEDKLFVIDFYFYETDVDDEFIVEKWNFQGMPHIKTKHLRIPKIYVYPIQFKDFQSSLIKFPSKPIYICEFLYGPDWKNKIKKDKEYTIKVINNKPVLLKIKKNFFFKKKLQIDLS